MRVRVPPMAVLLHVQLCGSNNSAAMLAAMRSAGDTPVTNLRNLVHAGNQVCKPGILPTSRHQKAKTGVSVAPNFFNKGIRVTRYHAIKQQLFYCADF